ncbi:carbohydrate ABC transporter permease [Halobaculum gomorrense]|uniref:Carbohydrate ABC transporter membrane protein 2, CUT1 family n=1 Tax=Halobaculum gomorrense TaxID=43928 RepID=A0A1M5RPZ6_9EURY|nr:carbohydrate ABC transporter permease [Halobaculum gomorrense]SHH28246.1 carbohydrate ABC transporter membrane protein 2, CUT1 family [Halobaculum gomorrense]
MSTDTSRTDRTDRLADIDGYRVGLYVAIGLLVAFFLTPIESGFVTSLKTDAAVGNTAPYLPPLFGGFSIANYVTAVEVLARGMGNSLLFAVPATLLSALLGSFAAYGLTLVDWKYQVPILVLFVAGVFIPYQAVLVPLSRLYSIVNVADLLWFVWAYTPVSVQYADLVELTVTHIAYGIPICTVLFRSYYTSMSTEMMEAARLDGASIRRVYRRIVFPLSTPMFAVVLIYQFTQIWNDLLFALVIVSTGSSPAAPVTLKLAGLGASLEGLDFGLRMAGAFVAALPTLLVYIAFGDEFAEGVAS